MSEELLKSALQAAYEKEFAVFATGEEHVFSFHHRRKMKKLFKQYYNVSKTDAAVKMPLKKRILIAVYIIIFTAILAVGVVAIATNGFNFDKKKDHTETLTVNWENAPETIEDIYYLADLPEEFKLIDSNISTNIAEFVFANNNGNFLNLFQNVKKDYHSYYNTEEYYLEEITVNGLNGFFIDCNGEILLVWDNEDYIMELFSNLTKEELLGLAKSVKIKN